MKKQTPKGVSRRYKHSVGKRPMITGDFDTDKARRHAYISYLYNLTGMPIHKLGIGEFIKINSKDVYALKKGIITEINGYTNRQYSIRRIRDDDGNVVFTAIWRVK